ncbi:MAG: hypothetical protein WBP16_14325 [Ferruginibacter sp.]
MKKLLIPLIAIFALTVTANAQGKMGKKGHQRHHQKGMMTKQLNFSEEQKSQAKTINADYRKKMQELNKQDNITVKEMRSRKAAIQKDKKAKMDGLLTAEQKTKVKQMKADQKVKREEGYAKRMDKMKTNLNLSDEQVTKLKTQRSASQAKAEKIKNNGSLSPEQKKEQMMALKAESKDQHSKIFTAEQLKKMQEMKKHRGNRMKAK